MLVFPSHPDMESKAIPRDFSQLVEQQYPEVSNNISFEGYEKPIQIGDKLIRVIPNKSMFASVILAIAYRERGFEELERVAQFIQNKGLNIGFVDSILFPTSEAYVNATPLLIGQPLRITFRRYHLQEYYEQLQSERMKLWDPPDELVFWHELYHVVQITRSPIIPILIRLLQTGIIPVYGWDNFARTGRRGLIKNLFLMPLMLWYVKELDSIELQTRSQTESLGNNFWGSGPLKQFRGKLFTFEEVN